MFTHTLDTPARRPDLGDRREQGYGLQNRHGEQPKVGAVVWLVRPGRRNSQPHQGTFGDGGGAITTTSAQPR